MSDHEGHLSPQDAWMTNAGDTLLRSIAELVSVANEINASLGDHEVGGQISGPTRQRLCSALRRLNGAMSVYGKPETQP
jgi:hypothetical protein